MGSIFKYFGEQGGPNSTHKGALHWPGTMDGFPFRGDQIPDLKADEIEDVPPVLDFHCGTFKLWIPEELEKYQEIRDRAANGWYNIQFIHRDTSKHDQISVYLEWIQIYGELPNGKIPKNGVGGKDFHFGNPVLGDSQPLPTGPAGS